jgi:RNA polymerase sigma-70 factor (ECF subfamily)
MTGADLATTLPSILPQLWACAVRITGDQHDAEDLVQNACVKALGRSHQLQPGTSPLGWMFSIIKSTWIDELRARRVRNRSDMAWNDDLLVDTVANLSVSSPEEHAMDRQIFNAVYRLPEAQREVLLLVGVEGLSYSEAAEALDVPIGTIMSRLSRARQSVAALFGDQNKSEPHRKL